MYNPTLKKVSVSCKTIDPLHKTVTKTIDPPTVRMEIKSFEDVQGTYALIYYHSHPAIKCSVSSNTAVSMDILPDCYLHIDKTPIFTFEKGMFMYIGYPELLATVIIALAAINKRQSMLSIDMANV